MPKFFWGGGTAPSPDPIPTGEGVSQIYCMCNVYSVYINAFVTIQHSNTVVTVCILGIWGNATVSVMGHTLDMVPSGFSRSTEYFLQII